MRTLVILGKILLNILLLLVLIWAGWEMANTPGPLLDRLMGVGWCVLIGAGLLVFWLDRLCGKNAETILVTLGKSLVCIVGLCGFAYVVWNLFTTPLAPLDALLWMGSFLCVGIVILLIWIGRVETLLENKKDKD